MLLVAATALAGSRADSGNVNGDNFTARLRRERKRRQAAEASEADAVQAMLGARRSSRPSAPCNGSSFVDRPRVSALVQAFGDAINARQLAQRLHALPSVEVLWVITDFHSTVFDLVQVVSKFPSAFSPLFLTDSSFLGAISIAL